MNKQNDELPPEVERYLALCERLYERMVREGTWPWQDSQKFRDLLESMDNEQDV